ncbi:MAG: oligosaccharide flippase family protein [Bdellovibrionota bacterium]
MLGTEEKNFENMLILSGGKFFGFFLTFLIPFFLSRWLTIEDYGTYKQIILLWMVFLQIQNLGMDLGLFYFVKTDPRNAPIFSLNVAAANLATTLLTIGALLFFSGQISNLLNNSQLATYIPYFCLVLLFSIPAQHFEHYLVSMDKIKWAFILEGLHEISKSCIIIMGFLFYNSLKTVLLMLSLLYLIKLCILICFNISLIKRHHINLSTGAAYLLKQVAYGFPLGIARIISAIIYFDKLIISFMYSVVQFTVYSVGCFEIPFVHTVLNTIWELASLEMVVARNTNDHQRLIALMRDTLRKIAILSIPIALFCIVFGKEIIIFIFSATYKNSVPYFRLFMLTFVANAFDCELLFRVCRENTVFLKIQVLNLLLTLLMMIFLGMIYGPLGALAGKIIAASISLIVMFKSVRRFLGVPLSEFLPWANIVWITLLCAFLSSSTYIFTTLAGMSGVLQLSFAATIYFVSVFLILSSFGIVSEMEKEYFKRKIIGLNIFAKQGIT